MAQLHSLSSGLTDPSAGIPDDELATRLLKQASEEFRATRCVDPQGASAIRSETEVQAFKRALEALLKVLSGSSSKRFRIASTSHRGVEYEIIGQR